MNPKELKKIEMKNDGGETERFVDLARKLVAVPKKEIDKRLEQERQEKAAKSEAKKARS
ncbi:MAG: hypothetical protein WBD27_12235 [Pyrinomonadaceae bacterium]